MSTNASSSRRREQRTDALDVQSELEKSRSARAVLRIDLDAIQKNVMEMRRISSGAKVMAIVKGDAYGLGVKTVAPFLQETGVEAFGVDNVAEGIELREMGIHRDILVLDGDVPELAPVAIRQGLTPGIANMELLAAYEAAAAAAGVRHPIWIYFNCGFNRSGPRRLDQFEKLAMAAAGMDHLQVEGVYTHLSESNGSEAVSLRQIEEYFAATEIAARVFRRKLQTSLFASHGVVRWADRYPSDWIRPGILLYGEDVFIEEMVEPESLKKMERFKPAATLVARIIHLLEFTDSQPVGYGPRFVTNPPQTLATLAIGYGGGYPPGHHKGYVVINNHKAPLFGAVGMDYLQVDVTGIPGVRLFDYATLLGGQGGNKISARILSRLAGTTPYVLFRRLNSQVEYRLGD